MDLYEADEKLRAEIKAAGALLELDSVTVFGLVVALNEKLDALIRMQHDHGYYASIMHPYKDWAGGE